MFRRQFLDYGGAGHAFFGQDILLKELCIGRFNAEIKLFSRHLLKLFDDGLKIQHVSAGIGRIAAAEQAAQTFQEIKVLLHHVGDQRALHLRYDFCSVAQHTVMNLSDGSSYGFIDWRLKKGGVLVY